MINKATLFVYATSSTGDMYGVIYGHGTDDADDFATDTSIWNRTRTTANVPWSAENLPAGWNEKDVTSIVQEIVDRDGWASGNSLALLLLGNTSATYKVISFYSHDYSSSRAARLNIDWAPATVSLGDHSSGQVADQIGETSSVSTSSLPYFW